VAYGLSHRHETQAEADPVASSAPPPSRTAITTVDGEIRRRLRFRSAVDGWVARSAIREARSFTLIKLI
jgi:hypothetical protein